MPSLDELIGLTLANKIATIRAQVPRVLKLFAQTESSETGEVDVHIWVVSDAALSAQEQKSVEKIVLDSLTSGQFLFLGVTPYFVFQTKAERERAGYAT